MHVADLASRMARMSSISGPGQKLPRASMVRVMVGAVLGHSVGVSSIAFTILPVRATRAGGSPAFGRVSDEQGGGAGLGHQPDDGGGAGGLAHAVDHVLGA